MKCVVEFCEDESWGPFPFCSKHMLLHIAVFSSEELEKFISTLEEVFKTLTYTEREMIKLRSGFGDGYTYTVEECSRIFKTSSEQIAEQEALALRKLKHPVLARELLKPFMQAVQASEKELIAFCANDPKRLHEITPRDFERIIAEIFKGFGFNVELTQATRDGGRDIIACRTDRLDITTKHIIECRRYASNQPIRVNMVRALYGVKEEQKADHAVLATTSYFTKDAEEFAEKPNVHNLHLKGYNEIVDWLTKYQDRFNRGGIELQEEKPDKGTIMEGGLFEA